MIARGSTDELEATRHLGWWRGMLPHWNAETDNFRRAARGEGKIAPHVLDEAERLRQDILAALDLCDTLVIDLPPGHEALSDLLRIAASFEALDASLDRSIEAIVPRIAREQEIAGLKFLVSALRRDVNLLQ
jgi:hypothetical protein